MLKGLKGLRGLRGLRGLIGHSLMMTLFGLLAIPVRVEAQRYTPSGNTIRTNDPSKVPGFPDVMAEYLQIAGARSGASPEDFDKATFLRVRTSGDGDQPQPANVVLLAMPGFSSTPSHWLFLASQLVHKAAERRCADNGRKSPCRLEVWLIQRRGANLTETTGAIEARRRKNPLIAAEYYFGTGILSLEPERPGRWPFALASKLTGRPGARWNPLRQDDLRFMADWGFETAAGDLDRMIDLIRRQSGSRNIFLAGHSQGGGFVSAYAGRRRQDGKRGYELLDGLIFLDGGPATGTPTAMTDGQLKDYLDRIERLRRGQSSAFTDASGLLGNLSGPAAAASMLVTGIYFGIEGPEAESIFAPRGMGVPVAESFLSSIRITNRARAGLSFDVDPIDGTGMQNGLISRLGEGLGQLDFSPRPGSESRCDPAKPVPPCIPMPDQIDKGRVYGWREGGGNGLVASRVGKAQLWFDSLSFSPARTNIRPVTHQFPSSGQRTIDASYLPAINWYPAERYEADMRLMAQFRTLRITANGIDIDVDKSSIREIPVYVARQSATAGINNPFPAVTDFTEINKKGTFQTEVAKRISEFDGSINAALYFHSDFISADDSLAGSVTPGQPGASVVANTLIDWLLKRSRGRAKTPTPLQLGVRRNF